VAVLAIEYLNKHPMKKSIICLFVIFLVACKGPTKSSGKLKVVVTTSMLTDLVKNIGGDLIDLQGLMGAGVDPHLYKASEGDVSKLFNADVIFYNGLHLEGKLVAVFEKMDTQKTTVALGEFLAKEGLIGSDYFASNYDPHVWFNIQYFKEFSDKVTSVLSEKDPKNAASFTANNLAFQQKLDLLQTRVVNTIATLTPEKRILVTAHDAFNYFGKAYGFKVVGLQGLSTATEAGVQDVQKLSEYIIANKVKAVFIESSVPRRTIEALQEAVLSKGHQVSIGGSLYSDALGDGGSVEGTYVGMFLYNVKTIVNALQ
jgi:manganese/zinc/iron transport system substrate-binding protein